MKQRILSLWIMIFVFCSYIVASESSGPLSFYKIGPKQCILFETSTWSKFGKAGFIIEVYSSPQPRAVIRLQLNASMIIADAEKAWGHRINAPVDKILTEADLKYLDSYLTAYRANGVQDNLSITSPGWEEFSLREKLADGGLICLKKEYYKPIKGIDTEFIKRFTGFDPTR